MRITIAIFIALVALVARSTTHTCSSCELAVVQATNDLAAVVSGDTISIPAGTCDWGSPAYFTNKSVRITGAGIGSTIIRDTYSGDPWLHVWLKPGLTTEIDNIEFRYVSGAAHDRIELQGINTDSRAINWHHCKFVDFNGMTLFATDTARGVFHHNQIVGCTLLAHVKDSWYDGTFRVRDYGNASAYSGDLFGTTNALFFEDNYLSNSAGCAIDAQAGGRYVYRFNTNYFMIPQSHGSEAASERSGRAFEVYSNIFEGNGSYSIAAYFRGGVLQLWGNTYTNWGFGTGFNLLDNRTLGHQFSPFTGATGSNPWDTNDPTGAFTSGSISNTGGPLGNTVTDFSKNFSTDQYSSYSLVRTSGKTVSSLTRSVGTATASVTGHGFSTGNLVSFWGANEYGWDDIFSITVLDADTFTFSSNYSYPTPATGTIKCCLGGNYALILSNTKSNITFADHINGPSYSLRLTNADTYEVRRVVQTMDQVGCFGVTNFGVNALPDVYSSFGGAQTVSCCYHWSNNFLGTAMVWDNRIGGGGGATYANIISGRHYSNNYAKPGYVPYTYPHPLASGSGNGSPSGEGPSGFSTSPLKFRFIRR